MPTRQQKRARARTPLKQKRRGQVAFLAVLVAVLLAGGVAIALFRNNPPELSRGAIQGEHWHADYQIEICGRRLAPYPHVEGEIHTHGDGKIHIHPQTPAFTGVNATLGNFLLNVETNIGIQEGKRFISFGDGKQYKDGDRCEPSGPRQRLTVLLNGKEYKQNPADLIMHNGDVVMIRFGPAAENPEPTANPLGPAQPVPEG